MALPAAAPAAGAEQTAEAAEAAKVFESLYGADVARVAKTRDAKDDIDLAKRLLDTARQDAANKPALVAVLCEKAADLGGSHADGAATAIEAMEFLGLQGPAKAGACTERVVEIREGQYNRARDAAKAEAGESLIDALLGLVDVKLDADDPSGAAVACRRAQAIARTIKSERCDQIDARLKEMAGLMKAAREIENMKALIERNPENVAAREKLVRLCLVDLDAPAAAAKHLEGVKDASLRKYVPAAAKDVEAAPELACLELGEWYRSLGEAAEEGAKAAMFARAQAYYQRFLGLHTSDDLNRTAATVALKKVEAELVRLGGAAASGTAAVPKDGIIKPGKWVDVLALVDPAKDTLAGKWQRTGAGLAMAPSDSARLMLPVSVSGSYEMEFRFARLTPAKRPAAGALNEVTFILPVGSSQVGCFLSIAGGESSGLGNINGKPPKENETTVRPGTLLDGRPYTLKVQVVVREEQCRISVLLDGKPYMSWEGSQGSASLPGRWQLPRPDALGMGGRTAKVLFGAARLRMLSGEARLLRPQGGTKATSTAKPLPVAKPTGQTIKPGKWIDLLKLVDPAKGVTKGTWKSKNGHLVSEPYRMGWAAVPCAPQGSYEMSVGFVRTGGNSEVVVILPVGSAAVALLIGQFHGSSSALRDAPGAAAKVKPGTLVNGQEYQLDIRVLLKGLTAEIDIYLNGKLYIRWEGLQSSLRACYRLPNPSCIGLGADMSTVVFGSARLKMLAGEARLVPPKGE